jgi:hypothetical protein
MDAANCSAQLSLFASATVRFAPIILDARMTHVQLRTEHGPWRMNLSALSIRQGKYPHYHERVLWEEEICLGHYGIDEAAVSVSIEWSVSDIRREGLWVLSHKILMGASCRLRFGDASWSFHSRA